MVTRRKSAPGIVLIFSLAFNMAFAGISAYYFISARASSREQDEAEFETRRSYPIPGRRERLQLSEEQQKVLEQRRQQFRLKLMDEREKAREIRQEFIALIQDPDSDPDDIARVADEFHRNQQKMRRMIFDDLLQLREILDEDQLKSFGDMLTGRYGMQPLHGRDDERTGRRRRTSKEDQEE